MANIKSQIKRNRQNDAAHERNKAVKSRLKTAVQGLGKDPAGRLQVYTGVTDHNDTPLATGLALIIPA